MSIEINSLIDNIGNDLKNTITTGLKQKFNPIINKIESTNKNMDTLKSVLCTLPEYIELSTNYKNLLVDYNNLVIENNYLREKLSNYSNVNLKITDNIFEDSHESSSYNTISNNIVLNDCLSKIRPNLSLGCLLMFTIPTTTRIRITFIEKLWIRIGYFVCCNSNSHSSQESNMS